MNDIEQKYASKPISWKTAKKKINNPNVREIIRRAKIKLGLQTKDI